ncbi:hypothetical protein LshimejAT787_0904220 [Lyophyllum shimeji]|uniref:F-box domain-containing protein n=1 Tax=Lyophyllum shimeji TaxID=47721 RepID=A0A9P3PTT4_LYOSH|nr:hypothetical protein LshimejAT787_0904220 [Lyophyllum shimeji]
MNDSQPLAHKSPPPPPQFLTSVMAKAVERTPYDVWVNISSFLPRSVLSTLSGVNRSFYEIATSARYEVVTFLKFDKQTKRLCKNLSDPNIGRGALVRHVKIEPWVVQPRLKPSHKRGESLWNFVNGVFDPHYAQKKLDERVKQRLQKDIRYVTDTISGMPNLSEYSLEWKHDRSYHPELYRAFLGPLLTRIRGRLVKLSLNVPPEMLRSLAPIALPRLEHLEVGVCTKKLSKGEINEIFDCFAVFVNNLFPTLQSLLISSRLPSQCLDLTRFFTLLGVFPHLSGFALSIPFDGTHLSQPRDLVTFLNKHHLTLQHLQLTTSRCSSADAPIDPESKYWIRNILTSLATPFPCLHDVHLALRPLKADLTPIIQFLADHARDLDALTLTERALTYTEVVDILDGIGAYGHSPRLKQLRLKLQHLSPALLELLASRVPRLAFLELSFGEVVATAAHPGHSGYPAHSSQEEFDLFEAEVRANRRLYAAWELVRIDICQDSRNARLGDLTRILVDCVPALQRVNQLDAASINLRV